MGQPAFILILVDDEARGQRLHDGLRNKLGHSCTVVTRLADAQESIRERAPDVVVALVSEHQAGAQLAQALDAVAPDAALVLAGPAPAARRVSVQSAPDGADDDRLVQLVGQAAARAAARREDRLLRESIEQQPIENFHGIVGASPAIRKIIERIRKVAPKGKMNVLILGETGTGKDLIAQAIHEESGRRSKPFRPLNCAAINENLLESILFGHIRGAFTGADRDQKGFFQAADGGTLFLDEIGEMPPHMQAKLLRAIEHREVTPVGSTEVRHVDVRVIAATNADLPKLVEDGRFRRDLYARLNAWEIRVPPLRERRQDIAILADYLRRRANQTHECNCPSISSEAMGYLTKYFWPMNVRELAGALEALVIEVGDRQIEAEDLPERIRGTRELVPVSSLGIGGLSLAQAERLMIEWTLKQTGGNREQAAKQLGIGTRTLYRKIKEFGL